MNLKSIHAIFTNRILRIPSYQRGYSWANSALITGKNASELKHIKGQLMDLWNDIVNIPEGKWHYTGLLTLVEVSTPEYTWLPNHKQYAIVDGQQRITSILILIAVIIEQAHRLQFELGVRDGDALFQYLYIQKAGLNANIFGYDQDNPSDKFFRKHILNMDIIEDDSGESAYTENLINSKTFFEHMVRGWMGSDGAQRERLKTLYNRVTSDLRMNEYILPKELDEYVVFETMNNRGKPLSELEKLKNRLMYLGDKFQIKQSESEDALILSTAQKLELEQSINTGWITIYQALGAKKQAPLDDEDFIKNHWIAYFDRYNRSEANAYAQHLFNEYFTIEQVYEGKLKPDDIRVYVKSLQISAGIWNKIHHLEFFPPNESECRDLLRGLHRVGFRASFKPIVLAVLAQKNRAEYLCVIKLLETYAFKLFYISDRQSNTGDSKLYRLASQIYHSNVTADNACEEIQGHMNYYYSFSLFKNQMEELFESGDRRGFYAWSGKHYFLFEYDRVLRNKNQTSTKASELNWEDFYNKNTIEHIYPQSAAKSYAEFADGSDTPERRNAYDRLQTDWQAFAHLEPNERYRLCNSLGNLLAITNRDNASFSNDPFLYKVDQSRKGDGYYNRGYLHDSMSAQMVAKESDWTPESIKQRGLQMLNAMLVFLGESVDSLTEKEKINLLGLDFLIATTNASDTQS
jgi:hypothetical protein